MASIQSADGPRLSCDDALLALVDGWVAQDPDEETAAELRTLRMSAALGDQRSRVALADRFASRLEFGTAGLRGALGGGPNRMNRVVVMQTAEGLARYLNATNPFPSIVIGYDARKNSRQFAVDTARIMAGNGIETLLLPRPLPTPVLAFAVRQLGRSAGVMVTASHNPPEDNGYKVYLGGANLGAQIVAPADARISDYILGAAEEPVTGYLTADTYEVASEEIVRRYLTRIEESADTDRARLRIVYTALHGVGWETARAAFARAGFTDVMPVHEQVAPDPAFPTVKFPNPEEPGALDLAFTAASRENADIIIANDPDADRLAVAVPTEGGWRRLTGNEVGALLGWRIAVRETTDGVASPARALVASLVSSPALRQVAETFRLNYIETLTGFKWIARAPGIIYGFEEALGYLVDPQAVRDKDGISAAIEFLALAAELKAQGSTVEDRLNGFAHLFGGHASIQVSLRFAEVSDIENLMRWLREKPLSQIGAAGVVGMDDFMDGVGDYPHSNILRYYLDDGSRVIIRPSGTEPKLKIYIDAQSSVGRSEERRESAAKSAKRIEEAVSHLLGMRPTG